MRLLDVPLVVREGPDGRLASFVWRGRKYRVAERVDLWREVGAWWEGEPEKTFLVVRTEPAGVFELYHTGPAPDGRPVWRLYKVYD
ncbi:MAG: DUF6504 family protein [Bacillota bacterium]|nr:DUF6504 family protein [Bacillota bacterium]